jgi:hypothetical protein
MQPRRILYVITTPEDKILHHILWNQQQHPSALFAIVAMNPTVDQWLRQKKVECSLIHGDQPYSPGRLEEFYHVMQDSIFRNMRIAASHLPLSSPPGTGGEENLRFVENIPIDRLLQFFEFESRQREREILNDVDFDELICSLDMHHPIIHSLLRRCIQLGIPTTAVQCSEIRTREMLDVALPFTRYVVDLEEDHDFLVREMGIKSEQIEMIGKTLYAVFDDMKDGIRNTSKKIANQLQLADNDRGIFLLYRRRHNWEIRRFLKVLQQVNESDPGRIILFVYCEDHDDTHEFLTLFNDALNSVYWRLAPNESDVTILNHCFPIWLAFRWNRDLEIASRLGQNVLIFDPFDYNCTHRLGVDNMAWKVVRQDDELAELLQSLPMEAMK